MFAFEPLAMPGSAAVSDPSATYRFVMRDIVNTTAADTHKHVKGMLCCPPRLHVCVRRTSCSQKPSGDSSACNSRADGSIMPFIGRFFDLYGWTCVMWVIDGMED